MSARPKMSPLVRRYLTTLRRVPDHIVLGTAAADLDVMYREACLCGWFVRARIAEMVGLEVEAVSAFDTTIPGVVRNEFPTNEVPHRASRLFGGTLDEWYAVYTDVTGYGDLALGGTTDAAVAAAAIEEAFTLRVMEAVERDA